MNLKKLFSKIFSLDAFCILLLAGIILFFFRKPLFSSEVFVSGDVGLSDFGDFFLPTRLFLSRSYHSAQLPLWSKDVGFGYPLFAEGQIQGLFPPNLIFLIFSPVFAYNFSIFLAVLTIGLTTYFFCRKGLQISPLPAAFVGLAFALSAPVTMRWKHLTMLWVLAFFPLELYLVERLFGSRDQHESTQIKSANLRESEVDGRFQIVSFILKMTLLVGFQGLAGHPQMVLYSAVVLFLFFVYKYFKEVVFTKRLNDRLEPLFTNREVSLLIKLSCAFAFSFLLGLIFAAPQILTTWELLRNSWRAEGFSYQGSLQFPFYFKHLVMLLVPFSFGDPSNWAPYLEYDPRVLIWEICAYSGLLTVVLGSLALSFLPLRGGKSSFAEKKIRKFAWFFVFLAVFSVLQARFNFLYYLPLFSASRVPARFVIFLSFSLCALAGLFLEDVVYNQVIKNWDKLAAGTAFNHWGKNFAKKVISVLLVMLIIVLAGDFYLYFGNYSRTVDKEDWFAKPGTVSYLEENLGGGRFVSLGHHFLVGHIYSEQRGWQKKPEAYLDYQKIIPPNRQLVWELPSASMYGGAYLEQAGNYREFLLEGFNVNGGEGKAYPPEGMANYLSFGGVTHVVSIFTIESEEFEEVYSEDLEHTEGTVYIYKVDGVLPRSHFVSKPRFVESEGEALSLMLTGSVGAGEDVVLEGDKEHTSTKLSANGPNGLETDDTDGEDMVRLSDCSIVKDGDQEVVVEVDAAGEGYLVLADTYYPGWRAYISRGVRDNNIGGNQQLISVDQGNTDSRGLLTDLRGWLKPANSSTSEVKSVETSEVSLGRLFSLNDSFAHGSEVSILRANYNFRAVRVPEGESTITFRYEPRSFRYGVMVSLLGVAVWTGLFVYALKKRRNRK